MKKLLALLVCLFPGFAVASPFAVGDVVAGVTECRVLLDGVDVGIVPAQSLECRFDAAGVSFGPHSLTMTAIINDPVWGVLESAQSGPLAFTRPSVPVVPTVPQLVK